MLTRLEGMSPPYGFERRIVTMSTLLMLHRTDSPLLGRLVIQRTASSNERMELTAPLGGRAGNGVVAAAASRAFARRRRSSSAVFCGHI